MDLRTLADQLAGDIVLPGDATWDAARQAWNLAVDQRPVAVVYPESADDVVATVRFAAEHGLRIAFNAGGHNTGPIDWTRDTLLLKTERMRGIEIDPERRRARVEAGVLVEAPRHRGRRARAGVSRRHVAGRRRPRLRARRRAELDGPQRTAWPATRSWRRTWSRADGRLVRVDRDTEPELFWALRGGSGNVAAVTALELELVPGRRDLRRRAALADRARDGDPERLARWIETVPETCESFGRMLQLPDVPFLPDAGPRTVVRAVELAFIGIGGGRRGTRSSRCATSEPEIDSVARDAAAAS